MFEPHLGDRDSGSQKTHPQKVFCSQRNREAEIVVAFWPHSEEGWSDWRVVHCSLLPPGAVRCAMDCLSQARVERE
jgi:hypothetical protein